MEGKKPGVLRNLRQKVQPLLPNLLRNKTFTNKSVSNKGALQTEMPRMSSSVPDIRQSYTPVLSTLQLPRTDASSYSSPTTPLNRLAERQAGGGSELRMRGGRSEQVLCVPSDYTDWNYSTNSQSHSGADMEPEELHLPEVMTIYCPQQLPADTLQVNTALTGIILQNHHLMHQLYYTICE